MRYFINVLGVLVFFASQLGFAGVPKGVPVDDWVMTLVLPEPKDIDAYVKANPGKIWAKDAVRAKILNSPEGILDGKSVWLSWADVEHLGEPLKKVIQRRFLRPVEADSELLEQLNHQQGNDYGRHAESGDISPLRLHYWSHKAGGREVGPLTSSAGYFGKDRMMVSFSKADITVPASDVILTKSFPTAVSGNLTALIRLKVKVEPGEEADVEWYSPKSGNFVTSKYSPKVIFDQARMRLNGFPSYNTERIMDEKLNEKGYYIYGVEDANGNIIVKGMEPRVLTEPAVGPRVPTYDIIHDPWQQIQWRSGLAAKALGTWKKRYQNMKGKFQVDKIGTEKIELGMEKFLIHIFGGILGDKEDGADGQKGFISGHFASGTSTTTIHPYSGLPWEKIKYLQVYGNGPDEIPPIASMYHYYAGSLEFGWMFLRTMRDALLHIPEFVTEIELKNGSKVTPLKGLEFAVQEMMAQYRVGFGKLLSKVNPITSCVQDTLLAFVVASEQLRENIKNKKDLNRGMRKILKRFKKKYFTSYNPRGDWKRYLESQDRQPAEGLEQLGAVLTTPKSLTPRYSYDELLRLLLPETTAGQQITTYQIISDFEGQDPIAATTFLGGIGGLINPVNVF